MAREYAPYPCDESGVCPYETFDNPDRMYFCRDHCGMGVDDSDDHEIWEDDDYDYVAGLEDAIPLEELFEQMKGEK